MIEAVVLCAARLSAAPPASAPRAERPSESRTDQDRVGLLAEYNARVAKVREAADSHWKLALWCGEFGLEAEALAHLSSVVWLAPEREAAWRTLGYDKHGDRRLAEAQAAEEEARKAASRLWAPRLATWHAHFHGGRKQAEAAGSVQRLSSIKTETRQGLMADARDGKWQNPREFDPICHLACSISHCRVG